MSTGRFTVAELRALHGGKDGGFAAVDRYYGWRHERAVMIAKGFGGAAASLLVAWLIPLLKGEYGEWPVALVVLTPVALLVAFGLVAWWMTMRLNAIHRAFVLAAEMLGLLP